MEVMEARYIDMFKFGLFSSVQLGYDLIIFKFTEDLLQVKNGWHDSFLFLKGAALIGTLTNFFVPNLGFRLVSPSLRMLTLLGM